MDDRERRRAEEKQKEIAARRAKMTVIEDAIAPLKFAPVREDASEYHYYRRNILTPEGEQVGHLAYETRGRYSYEPRKDRFRIQSKRIPSRTTWRSSGGHRDYRKIESAIAAIKKFCLPVSHDEDRAKVLRGEITKYLRKVDESWKNSQGLSNGAHWYPKPDLPRIIEGLANDNDEAQEKLDILVKKYRVHKRFAAFLEGNFIGPRQKELDALDTSKEMIE